METGPGGGGGGGGSGPKQLISHLPRPAPYKGGQTISWSSINSASHNKLTQAQAYYPFQIKRYDLPTTPTGTSSVPPGPEGEGVGNSNRYGSMECLSGQNLGNEEPWKTAGPGYRYSISTTGSGSTTELEPLRVPSTLSNGSGIGEGSSNENSGDFQTNSSPSKGSYDVKMAERIRKSTEQKEAFLRRPNLVWAPLQMSPTVPKELYVQPQKFSRVPWPPDQVLLNKGPPNSTPNLDSVPRTLSPSRSNVEQLRVYSSLDEGGERRGHGVVQQQRSRTSPSIPEYLGPKNRLTVVGSGKLHCDPPLDWNPQINTQETEHVQTTNGGTTTLMGDGDGGFGETRNGGRRPKYLPLPRPNMELKSNFIVAAASKGSSGHSNGIRPIPSKDPRALEGLVVMRRRESDPEFDNDRLVRRVSYLKATSSPIEMERKGSNPTTPNKSPSSEFRGIGENETPDDSPVVREGMVQFKIRAGDKQKSVHNRNWKPRWAQVRRSGMLYLSKERLGKDGPTSQDDILMSIGLRADGLTIESAEDYTKRKNVIRLRHGGSIAEQSSAATFEILLQAEDPVDLKQWIFALTSQQDNNNVYTNENNTPRSIPIPTSGPITSTSISLPTATFLSGSPAVTSPKSKTWKGKVARQWKKIHLATGNSPGSTTGYNPSGASLESGVTFGVPIEETPPGLVNTAIPRVIEFCIDTVEKRGLSIVGIYRIPGNNAAIASLTDSLNKGNEPNEEEDPKWRDVHVISSLLKSFLRKLPDPLLTSERYPHFISAVDQEDEEKVKARVQELILDLPEPNYATLKALIMHLRKVAENSEANRMEARNLAIVFGPTLVRTAQENVASMVNDMKHQCKIVELLVNQANEFFKSPKKSEVPVGNDYSSIQVLTCPVSTTSTVPVQAKSPIKIPNDIRTSLIQAAQRKVLHQSSTNNNHSPPPHNTYGLPNTPPLPRVPNTLISIGAIDESGQIRSYSGLDSETEQRVRQFEMETRALLTRDGRGGRAPSLVNAQTVPDESRNNFIRLNIQRLEEELRKAKHDMENEDYYDEIADNPSSIVQHREHSSFYPIQPNHSSSSISSNNSGTYPSTTWPIKLGPTPFKPTNPLPPKAPISKQHSVPIGSTYLHPRPTDLPPLLRRDGGGSENNPQSFIRPVQASGERSFLLRKSSVPNESNIDRQGKMFGSLDSLRDVPNGGSQVNLSKSGEEDSPRSSDGSDMVSSLSRALDQKLERLHNQPSIDERPFPIHSQHTAKDRRDFLSLQLDGNHHQGEEPVFSSLPPSLPHHHQSNGHKPRRNSYIDQTKLALSPLDPTKEFLNSTSSPQKLQVFYRDKLNAPLLSNGHGWEEKSRVKSTKSVDPSSNNKKGRKDSPRRHSLSGTADIFRFMLNPSEKSSSKNLSSEALASALSANQNILESHV